MNCIRGDWTTRLSKVKGHSTKEDIAAGRATQEEHNCDEAADTFAKKGSDWGGLGNIARAFQERHAAYCHT